ncbi:MAG: hypothetical protein AABY88_09095 [Pseudomonadota bacterium]
MSKVDWSKAGQASHDPSRVSKFSAKFRAFPPTPTARREFEQAKKARSDAARKAAKTRKLNKERREEAERQAELDAVARRERDKEFFAYEQKNLRARRQQRDKKMQSVQTATGQLGAILQEALDRFSKK